MKIYQPFLFFLLIAVNHALAQGTAIWSDSNFFNAIRANQNESYLTFTQGLGNLEPLIFEAIIEPYFLIRTSKDARWGATLSPAIRLRMYAEESLPVRTPSYNPYVTFYHQLRLSSSKKLHTAYLFLTLAHHSNGQENDFYLPNGDINTKNGNFATNYLEFGLFVNRHLLPFVHTNEYLKTSLEFHPGLDMSPELKGRYGMLRWHNRLKIYRFAQHQWKKKAVTSLTTLSQVPAWSAILETNWIFGEKDGAKALDFSRRFNLMAKLAYKPPHTRDVSFFVKLYTGEDYYNIYFFRRISYLQFGLQAFAF